MNILERLNSELEKDNKKDFNKIIDLGDIKDQLKNIDKFMSAEGKYKEDYSYPLGYVKGIYAIIGELNRKGVKVVMSGLRQARDVMIDIATKLPSQKGEKPQSIDTTPIDKLNTLLAQKKLKSLEEDKKLYTKLIQTYGTTQLIVAIEELSELQKEICKALRNKAKNENILEEVADVYIMLEQIKLYFALTDEEVINTIKQKNNRTRERFTGGNL